MKRIFLVVGTALFGSLAIAQSNTSLVSRPAPPVIFQHNPGSKIDKDFYKGKILVLDFWATWCAPCIANFPHFNKLADTYKSKDVVFAIISDEPQKTVQQFFDRTKKQVNALSLTDSTKSTSNAFNLQFLPMSVVVDKNNIIRWIGSGELLTDTILSAIINNKPLAVTTADIPKPAIVNKKAVALKPVFSFDVKLADTSTKTAPGGGNSSFNNDYVTYDATNNSLGKIIEEITGYGKAARIITNDTTRLNQLINVNFKSRFDTSLFKNYANTILINKPRKNLIVYLLGESLKFDAKIVNETKKHYELVIVDTAKLHKFMSMQNGHSSFSDDYLPRFEAVGYNLKNIAKLLEGSAQIIITTNITDDNRYDLSLNVKDIKTTRETLNFHGLDLKEVNSKVDLLNINFY